MDGSADPRMSADKLLLKEGLILSYLESVSGELELTTLLDRLLYHACDLIEADDGTIGLVESDEGVMRIAAEYQMPQSEMGALYEPGVGVGTVKGYVSAVLAKLAVNDRTQAALWAVRHGVVDPAAEETG